MKFIAIDPKAQTVREIEDKDLPEALAQIGLSSREVDFGSLSSRRSIVVFEYGLIDGHPAGYFTLAESFYVGPALIFAYDEQGETESTSAEDLARVEKVIAYWPTIEDVEAGIAAGRIIRPETRVNGEVIWEFNRP